MKIVNLDEKKSSTKKKENAEIVEMLSTVKGLAENGELQEFVMAWYGKDDNVQITVHIKDMVGGVGLFEIGKTILISQSQYQDE